MKPQGVRKLGLLSEGLPITRGLLFNDLLRFLVVLLIVYNYVWTKKD